MTSSTHFADVKGNSFLIEGGGGGALQAQGRKKGPCLIELLIRNLMSTEIFANGLISKVRALNDTQKKAATLISFTSKMLFTGGF